MNRSISLAVLILLAACGGGDAPADAASQPQAAPSTAADAPAAEMTMPEWMQVDETAMTVHLTITAGATDAKNYWNFNGGHDGNMTITVPEGYAVTVDFENADPVMAHSLGVVAQSGGFGAMVDPAPAFEGALTSNPTSMVEATMPGQSETITFTADTAGEYAMICFIPGHAATGMYVHFNVSADGAAGVEGAM